MPLPELQEQSRCGNTVVRLSNNIILFRHLVWVFGCIGVWVYVYVQCAIFPPFLSELGLMIAYFFMIKKTTTMCVRVIVCVCVRACVCAYGEHEPTDLLTHESVSSGSHISSKVQDEVLCEMGTFYGTKVKHRITAI